MLAFFSPPVILTVRLLLIQPYALFGSTRFLSTKNEAYLSHASLLYTCFFRLSRRKTQIFLKNTRFFQCDTPGPVVSFSFLQKTSEFIRISLLFLLSFAFPRKYLAIQHIHDQKIHIGENRNYSQHSHDLQYDQIRAVYSDIRRDQCHIGRPGRSNH